VRCEVIRRVLDTGLVGWLVGCLLVVWLVCWLVVCWVAGCFVV